MEVSTVYKEREGKRRKGRAAKFIRSSFLFYKRITTIKKTYIGKLTRSIRLSECGCSVLK